MRKELNQLTRCGRFSATGEPLAGGVLPVRPGKTVNVLVIMGAQDNPGGMVKS